jgi:hypothetical protein
MSFVGLVTALSVPFLLFSITCTKVIESVDLIKLAHDHKNAAQDTSGCFIPKTSLRHITNARYDREAKFCRVAVTTLFIQSKIAIKTDIGHRL